MKDDYSEYVTLWVFANWKEGRYRTRNGQPLLGSMPSDLFNEAHFAWLRYDKDKGKRWVVPS